jgi:hypothetical protein
LKIGRLEDDAIVSIGPVLASMARLRNRITKYNPEDLIDCCLMLLAENDSASLDEFKEPLPWKILLFIKWVLIESISSPDSGKEPQNYEIISLFKSLDRCYELYESVSLPKEDKGWHFLFRKLAFEQFPFQKPINRCVLARQNLLFGYLELQHPIRRKFFERAGIELTSFLDLAFVLVGIELISANRIVAESSFRLLAKYYPENTINKFLQLISADLLTIRRYLNDLQTKHNPKTEHQLFEMSPLKRYPLLNKGTQYCPYSKRLLYISMQHWVYDMLRDNEHEREWFGSQFGPLFERYVEEVITSMSPHVITEDNLKQKLGKKYKGKFVDFVVLDDDSKVFVDAKGVEMSYLGQVSNNPDDIARAIDSSIIKAIKQANSLIDRIRQFRVINDIEMPSNGENFLLVITYKDLHVANGRALRVLLPELIEELCQRYNSIPIENMYFMSIDEFEMLAQAVNEKKIGLVESLRRARIADNETHSRKLMFSQHLENWCRPDGVPIPKFLNEEFENTVKRLGGRLHPSSVDADISCS